MSKMNVKVRESKEFPGLTVKIAKGHGMTTLTFSYKGSDFMGQTIEDATGKLKGIGEWYDFRGVPSYARDTLRAHASKTVWAFCQARGAKPDEEDPGNREERLLVEREIAEGEARKARLARKAS